MKNYVYNEETMTYEVRTTPLWSFVLRYVLLSAVAVASVFFYFWVYLEVLHLELPKTLILKKKNAEWQYRMDVLDRELDRYDAVLSGIEQRDDDVYRSIFGLVTIPEAMRNSGFGGATRYDWVDEYGAGPELKEMVRRVDVMTKRVVLRSAALDEVAQVSKKAGDMVACIPAVPPIMPAPGTYHISSPFGYRIDPVYGGRRFHEGIDFAGKVGLPVYAVGDGVVEKVDYKYSGYGNEIVIDHGFGYKTRYAHMNTIEVAQGSRVHRGDKVGELGKSGKATGPHLHFEVIYKGSQVNPWGFFDMSMPLGEYKAMVDERKAAAKKDPPTASDLLRRRNSRLR